MKLTPSAGLTSMLHPLAHFLTTHVPRWQSTSDTPGMDVQSTPVAGVGPNPIVQPPPTIAQ